MRRVDKYMQVSNEKQTGFSAELKIVPAWAWTLAALGFAAPFIFSRAFLSGSHFSPWWGRLLMETLAGSVMGCYFLLLGYVGRDAKRRDMSPLLWTMVAILIPNALGLVLYFVLRQPRRVICPQCGSAIQAGFNFCPRCSHKLSPSCPQCHRLVGGNDLYCPHCGASVSEVPVVESAARPEAFK